MAATTSFPMSQGLMFQLAESCGKCIEITGPSSVLTRDCEGAENQMGKEKPEKEWERQQQAP